MSVQDDIIDVTIIIVNYNAALLITHCLTSIFEFTTGLKYEIIVIDNNSIQNPAEIISSILPDYELSEIKYIFLPENLGFGRANNEGIKIAKGRNILFLNPDTKLLNNAIKILSDFLDHTPLAGACGGNLYNDNLKPIHSYRKIFPGIYWELNELLNNIPDKLFYHKNRFHNEKGTPEEVAYITGADLMVKREILSQTGGFSPEFFMYYEETDLCKKIKNLGWRIYNVPEARIIHSEGSYNPSGILYPSEQKIRNIERSRISYYNLNNSKINKFIANKIYSIFLKSRILFLKNRDKKRYYSTRLKYLKSLKKSP